MSLSKTTLSAIQQAGQALHQATVVVAGAVREQAEHMVSTVASQPFEAEGEQAFANFKMLARLSQDLQALEGQLRNLYATASELSSPEMDVVTALQHTQTRSRANTGKDAVEDAIVKPASTQRAAKSAKNTKAAKGTNKSKTATLTANDSKLMQFLQTALNPGTWTTLTGAAMAKGSGLPLGSVGISLKKVMGTGAVKKGDRGSYKLRA